MSPRYAVVFVVFAASASGQQKQSTQPKTPDPAQSSVQMSSGVLAILADQAGALFVDGVEEGKAVPGNILALKLMAGQHFVDFRDGDGKKVWEKVVSIPAGSQVAERISPKTPPDSGAIATPSPSAPPAVSGNSGSVTIAADNEDFIVPAIDLISIEKKIAAYFIRKGIKNTLVSSPDGKQHGVQVNFLPPAATPERPPLRYTITATASSDGGKSHLILMTAGTGVKTAANDAIRTAINDANRISSCSWYIDTDKEIMCRTWPPMSEGYSTPIQQLIDIIQAISGRWNDFYPKIKPNIE